MSNRKRRQMRRGASKTLRQRWLEERYKPHRNLSSREVRAILVEDGVRRQPTPLTWFVQGITYIATRENLPRDTVFVQINEAVIEGCGFPLPTSGVLR